MSGNRVSPSPCAEPSQGKPTNKQHETTRWFLKNINANAYLCNKESDAKIMCHCENKQEKDTPNVEKHPNESDTEHTSYVGEISFVNNQKSANIRLYSNTAIPNNVLTMLNNKWKLKIPDLLIYVHGCMKGLANTYRTSLTKVVKSTGAWIITDGKHEYVNIDNISEQPIIIGISELGDIINHQKDNPQVIGADTVLNSNHSHFILIDDGSRNTLSTTMIFRKELEREITKNGSWKEVPSVRIVFQGDDDRKKGYDGQETDISVVTVKTSDREVTVTKEQYPMAENNATFKVTHTCELNEDSSDSDLGLAILQALLKDARNKTNIKNRKYLLKLFEIAKNIQIYTILQQVKVLESCMMAALLEDKVEYVKLMLDNDFDLKAFLKQDILQELYNAQANEPSFREVKKKMHDLTKVWLRPNTMPKVYKLLEYLLSDSNIKLTKKESTQSSNGENANKHQVDEDSCMDLFVWSVLNNRQDMAKLFWRLGKDAMASALFAHALLSALSDKIDDADFKEICEKNSREFTKLATEVLKDGYTKGGVNLAKKLLIQKQKRWGDTSCVLIAVNANNKQFISNQACQEVFNNIWMGKIDQESGNLCKNLKLLLCIFFPLLIFFRVKFRNEDPKPSKSVQTSDQPNSNRDNDQEVEYNTDSSEQGQEPTICLKLKYFFQAPVIKCFLNVISYLIFLALYSYSLLSKVNRYLSWQEILLCVWVFTIFTQEVIDFWSTSPKDMTRKFYNYIKDGWNIIDIVTVVLFLLGMILRIIDNPEVAESALVFHGINLITFYLRLLQLFSVHRELGPKLVMIIDMVKRMFYFCMILAVFIVAYGIVSHAILYPHTEPSFETIREIIRRPYWNIYGELMLDTFEDSPDCTNDPALYNSGSNTRCPTEVGKYFVPLLLGVYMLMCNILLLNLLIAVFSNTFQKVHDKSNLYWSNQQYSLIYEYASRPVLVPPVIILYHLYLLFIGKVRKANVFCAAGVLCSDEEKEIEKRIKDRMECNSSNVCDADSRDLGKRIEQVEKQLNTLVEMQSEILETIKPDKDFSR